MKLLKPIKRLLHGRVPSLSAVSHPRQLKYLYRWYQSRRENYLLDNAVPWLTFDAAEAIERYVKPGMRVFEYGSGSSTLWWLRLGAEVISVEHDPKWYEMLSQRLRNEQRDKSLMLVEADSSISSDVLYLNPDGRSFRAYASAIDNYPDQYFDIILVDGVSRPACIRHGVPKLKPNGLLIVDNTNAPHHLADVTDILTCFKRQTFQGLAPIDGSLSQTDLFFSDCF